MKAGRISSGLSFEYPSEQLLAELLVVSALLALLFSVSFQRKVSSSAYGGLEQLVVHKAHNLEVAGSNPAAASRAQAKAESITLIASG